MEMVKAFSNNFILFIHSLKQAKQVYQSRHKGLEYDFSVTKEYFRGNGKHWKGAPAHCPVILGQDLTGRQKKFAEGNILVWDKVDFFLGFHKKNPLISQCDQKDVFYLLLKL